MTRHEISKLMFIPYKSVFTYINMSNDQAKKHISGEKDTYYFIYNNLKNRYNIKNVINDHQSAVISALKDLNLTFVNDTFHLFLYISNKNLRNILYKYIKFLKKEGVKDYGLFGSHCYFF